MLRHPHYVGRKVETVPSVGSRMPGVVRPSYGKPKLTLASNPLKLTGDSRSFGFNPLGPADLDALSPYRTTRSVRRELAQCRERRKLERFAHKIGRAVDKQAPRLVKP
jgi:hypothetical protein